MKINFKKPKYLIPLFLIPFILLFYYLFGRPSGKERVKTSPSTTAQGLQSTMPSVDSAISEKGIKNKFSTYQQIYKNATDSSAIQDLQTQQLSGQDSYSSVYSSSDLQKLRNARRMDSLNQTLATGQAKMQQALNSFNEQIRNPGSGYSSLDRNNSRSDEEIIASLNKLNQPDNNPVNPSSSDNDDMKDFKERMLFMDSLRKAALTGTPESSSAIDNKLTQRNYLPESNPASTPKPLHVSTVVHHTVNTFNTVTGIKSDQNAITAMIDQNMKVVAGSRVRIRLLQDIFVGGYKISKGSYIYGMVTGFQTQRVNISITQIQYEGQSLPVRLNVYDNDGYLGLYVPGSNFREFTKEIGTEATQGMSQVITPDQSNVKMNLFSQLFNTTTTTMASLIRKDKAFLKYDYVVFLKEDSPKTRSEN